MLLPFDRDRLRQRNALDAGQELAASAEKTPSERFVETVELSDVVRQLAVATGSEGKTADLETKSLLYVRPLRLAMRS
ncbi:MAG: hypothetical protein JW940_35330 [Polyangiaceae bacterium]|nr:hypothetical protein [Polyangiaceae bacterium]